MHTARSKPARSSARQSSPCNERRCPVVVSTAQTAEIKKRLQEPHRREAAWARRPTQTQEPWLCTDGHQYALTGRAVIGRSGRPADRQVLRKPRTDYLASSAWRFEQGGDLGDGFGAWADVSHRAARVAVPGLGHDQLQRDALFAEVGGCRVAELVQLPP